MQLPDKPHHLHVCFVHCTRWLQLYYRCSSRELRRLDALALSPLYAAFSEAQDGAASIRAYGAQERFAEVGAVL